MPPVDDLLTIVTRDYAISRAYKPADLVPLADYFDVRVTLGFPTEVRAVMVEPLQQIIAAMQADGLRPTIISGYRSYASQQLAYEKWTSQYDHGAIISARPGTSEHQLGVTIDFGSPELDNEFHTNFAYTSEGVWLAENAHRFGFTLSYPRRAQEVTQFFYEPWHFRYVGEPLATTLQDENITLTEYQLATFGPPCIPAQ
jgi:D-alanyl-D-alanine carboxypeptidase